MRGLVVSPRLPLPHYPSWTKLEKTTPEKKTLKRLPPDISPLANCGSSLQGGVCEYLRTGGSELPDLSISCAFIGDPPEIFCRTPQKLGQDPPSWSWPTVGERCPGTRQARPRGGLKHCMERPHLSNDMQQVQGGWGREQRPNRPGSQVHLGELVGCSLSPFHACPLKDPD